jgi:hypothetical protein
MVLTNASFPPEPWKYNVPFFNPNTYERRIVTVQLSASEVADAKWHAVVRGNQGPGGPDGPIARACALRRAAHGMPRNFLECIAEIRRIMPPHLRLIHGAARAAPEVQ